MSDTWYLTGDPLALLPALFFQIKAGSVDITFAVLLATVATHAHWCSQHSWLAAEGPDGHFRGLLFCDVITSYVNANSGALRRDR